MQENLTLQYENINEKYFYKMFELKRRKHNFILICMRSIYAHFFQFTDKDVDFKFRDILLNVSFHSQHQK